MRSQCCEEAYAVYRKGTWPNLFGHAGIYEGCDGNHEISDWEHHFVIESIPTLGVHKITFDHFYNSPDLVNPTTDFWGIRSHPKLTSWQRSVIVEEARNHIGTPWNFFRYKNPGEGFRCDGLVEYVYEVAGIDIVSKDSLLRLNPRRQFKALSCMP